MTRAILAGPAFAFVNIVGTIHASVTRITITRVLVDYFLARSMDAWIRRAELDLDVAVLIRVGRLTQTQMVLAPRNARAVHA